MKCNLVIKRFSERLKLNGIREKNCGGNEKTHLNCVCQIKTRQSFGSECA